MNIDDWLKHGYDMGWVGPPVCDIHDGTPTSADEDNQWDTDGDVCIHVLRLYRSHDEKTAVEANHPPSTWRATNKWGENR